jgi:tRNA1Val (adenine37-N6)-methyltransferase
MAVGNPYFRFKQFVIHQDRCAMKVTTDACILGAWTPIPDNASRVLDIGAGTGLLALMLAQRDGDVVIDAVELDEAAAEQAGENAASCPWHERVHILRSDARGFHGVRKYDLIITNPPFFNNSLVGPSDERNAARHTPTLSYEALLQAIADNLSEDGSVSVLLPYPEFMLFRGKAKSYGLTLSQQLLIKHRPAAEVKRVVGIFTNGAVGQLKEEVLTIQDENDRYSARFSELLAPYYLAL